MEGKRFGVGIAAGLILGLALVAVSGGLGGTPLAQLSPRGGAVSTTTASSTLILTVTATSASTVTYTVATSTTTGGSSIPSQWSNGTKAYTSTSTTTVITSAPASSTSNGTPSESGATNATSGVTDGAFIPAGNNPTRLANIPQQPIVSNAEILVPVLIAFLLGAFLYRVTVRERERSDAEA